MLTGYTESLGFQTCGFPNAGWNARLRMLIESRKDFPLPSNGLEFLAAERHLRRENGIMLLTASHSSFDEVKSGANEFTRRAGSTSPVPAIIADDYRGRLGRRREGNLHDLGPTIFEIIGIEEPECMNGQSLIAH